MRFLNLFLLCAYSVAGAPAAIHGTAAIPVDLTPLYNNRAFASKVGDANYNGHGGMLPS